MVHAKGSAAHRAKLLQNKGHVWIFLSYVRDMREIEIDVSTATEAIL